jgi:hypothetical protein
VRKIDTAGIITTFAGRGSSGSLGDGGAATDAALTAPLDVTADRWGNIYIADAGDHRVRKVDTTVLGAVGISVQSGTLYEDVLIEARLADPSIQQCENYTIEEARLVLKYVMVIGNKMAYAKHIYHKTDRMCSKIENMVECGLHLDNRIGHNQFNKTVKFIVERGHRGNIHDKLERISDILVRALSHLPLEAAKAPCPCPTL